MPKITKGASKTLPPKTASKRKPGKYVMPEPLPNGEILTDLSKKEWKLGPSIGKGGFGEIYSAIDVSSGKNSYVVKIEPKENGPLFVEMHFFMKVCKSEDIDKWMKSKNLKFLGLPRFVGNGSHQHNGKSYRFVVMEKYGKNLDAVLKENKNVLPSDRIYKIALQIMDVLEYIHSKGYVHADVKGGNLLFGLTKGTGDNVYVVDFGLASKYPKDFKPDPKCAHNGTIEFTSRDAHVGATTRRSDLEILAYNMLRWFTAKLPWENKLTDCSYVQQQKLQFMRGIPEFLQKCFGSQPVPEALKKYFEYISNMPPTEAPDYDFCRRLFHEALKRQATSGKQSKVSSPVKVVSQKSKKATKEDNSDNQDVQKVEKRQASPSMDKMQESPKVKIQRSPKVKIQKSPNVKIQKSPKIRIKKSPFKVVGKQLEKDSVSREMRKVRAVRNVNHVANGYVPESDSFTESDTDDDGGDGDYKPQVVYSKTKAVKRHSNEKKVHSPKKKRS